MLKNFVRNLLLKASTHFRGKIVASFMSVEARLTFGIFNLDVTIVGYFGTLLRHFLVL